MKTEISKNTWLFYLLDQRRENATPKIISNTVVGQSLTRNYENSQTTVAQDHTTLVMVLKNIPRTRGNITSYFPSFLKNSLSEIPWKDF